MSLISLSCYFYLIFFSIFFSALSPSWKLNILDPYGSRSREQSIVLGFLFVCFGGIGLFVFFCLVVFTLLGQLAQQLFSTRHPQGNFLLANWFEIKNWIYNFDNNTYEKHDSEGWMKSRLSFLPKLCNRCLQTMVSSIFSEEELLKCDNSIRKFRS